MSAQRNVSQQNEFALAKMRDTCRLFHSRGARITWLSDVLTSRGLDPSSGALVALSETPEQEGQLFSGTWLTSSRQFFDFVVIVSRGYASVLKVEAFDETTGETVVSEHTPGTGKSFGFLALQVLTECDES